jgi:hypothetical protein
MLFQHSIELECPPDALVEKMMSPRLFVHVSWPLLQFKSVDPATAPERWVERTYVVRLWLFGLLPLGIHNIVLTCRDRSSEMGKFWFELRDNGYSKSIPKWDHTMTVRKNSTGCSYTDSVEIKAGIVTPIIWAFASVLYRYRQRRLKRLVQNGFVFPALFGK